MSQEQELFEDFSSTVVSSIIKKSWSVIYKGKEITGTYEYENDDWGLQEMNTVIDEGYTLTDEERDEILDYVKDAIY
jgi:hypothetical protein